ncbi:MAG: acetyl-coenzyme A synthetase, partial [Actinobacteria bacterium]|nr:acetyl-coenzyme A synthetase [Actinomycetota bacterium]
MTDGQHAIDALSFEQRKFPPSASFVATAHANNRDLFVEADNDYEAFWARQARENVTWSSPWTKVCEWDLPFSEWFVGGTLNVSYNCLDRHVLAGKGEKVAF